MRKSISIAALVVLAAAPLAAQDSTHAVCRDAPCLLVFDWSNGGSPPDPDKRYGSSADLEQAFRGRLTAAGYKLATSAPAANTITLRLTPQTRALCDTMEGMNPDYSCHSVSRATIVFSASDPNASPIARIDVSPRCRDPKVAITMAQFGQYAGDLVIYTLSPDPKPGRPSAKC